MTNLQPIDGEIAMDKAVGRRIYMLMWDRGLTQAQLGQVIHMDQSSVGKRLRGERGWTINQLAAVCIALKTTFSYLLGEIEDPDLPPRELWDRARKEYSEWAPWGSNPRPADYIGVGSASNRITFAEVVSIDAAPRFRELVTA